VRRTWAKKGMTPVIASSGSWKTRSAIGMIACTPHGQRPRFFLGVRKRACRSGDFIRTLQSLRRHVRGKVFLIWDGLGGHWSKEVRAFAEGNRSWLTLFRFPAYAPELNPVEGVWSSSKGRDFANFCPKDIEELERRIRSSGRRIGRDPDLLRGLLKGSELFG